MVLFFRFNIPVFNFAFLLRMCNFLQFLEHGVEDDLAISGSDNILYQIQCFSSDGETLVVQGICDFHDLYCFLIN